MLILTTGFAILLCLSEVDVGLDYQSFIQWIIPITVFIIIWLIRLEAKVIYMGNDHDKLEKLSTKTNDDFSKKIDSLTQGLNDIKVSLGRIEGSINQIDKKKNI